MNPSEQRPTPETDAMHAKQGLTHASYRDFARKLERQRDKLKQWKDEMMQVGGWWLAVDEAVREHPDAIAGHNVSDTALRFIRERDEARKHLRDANRGAQVNARINQSMAGKLNEAAKQLEAMREAIGVAAEALKAIAEAKDAPDIDIGGESQFGLHCGVEDRGCQSRYDGADVGWSQGVERTLEWSTNEANSALAKLQPFLKP